MASSNMLASNRPLPARDPEAQRPPAAPRPSHWKRLTDSASLDDAVLAHRYPGRGTAESPYLVDFLPDDARNPMTFPNSLKWLITAITAIATLSITFASSAYTGGLNSMAAEFRASTEVMILGVSMFVLGFALGPLLWGPLSELYGRQYIFFFTFLVMTVLNAAAAAAPSMAALIVLRFFAAAFGSSPLANGGGTIADMFAASERGIAACFYALAPFWGPALGPIAGGFLGESKGWRWVHGMIAIVTGVILVANTLIYPETYAPVLLRRRADALSKVTGKVYISKLDAGRPKKSVGGELRVAISRPLVLLFREPIVGLLSLYLAIIYGTLYMCFAAFPIVYQKGRHWSPGTGGLAFTGMAIGILFGVTGILLDHKRYRRVEAECDGKAPPEARLPPALVGSIILPMGLFWFAWTNGPDMHWIVSIMGTAVFGAGLVLVFLTSLNYLIDSYVIYAASVLAASSVLRSLFGAAFPLFTTYMYDDLGIHWASSIPAFLALACVPFPFLFYRYGASIRAKCKFAAEAARVLDTMRSKQVRVVDDDEADEADREKHHPGDAAGLRVAGG